MKRLLLLGLAACVPSTRELREPVDAVLVQRAGLARTADLDALLAKPLDEHAAVAIALANNAHLAAALDDLGIAGGELATALGLGPLVIDGQLRWGPHGHEYEVDAVQNVLGLVTAPRRRAAATADLAAARASAAATALALAARTEIAFHDLIAARQRVELRRAAFDAADAAATVRERMQAAGNTTELALAHDRAAREQARIELARAETTAELRREAIDDLLGLSGPRTNWTATGTLPEVPSQAPRLDDLEAAAVTASLELAAGRAHVEAAGDRAAAITVTSILPELGVGVSVIDRDGELEVGPAIRIGLPLFDQRAGERARAGAEAAHRDHELAATGVELRARARAVRVAALAVYAEARHIHDVLLPLRQQIVDETLLHYNAMDADPFELIRARQSLVDSSAAYLDALRRYADAMTEVTALRRGVMIRRSLDDGQP
ncbi:MAG: TolC family protein [Kofleriaceae bacterium]